MYLSLDVFVLKCFVVDEGLLFVMRGLVGLLEREESYGDHSGCVIRFGGGNV